MDVDSSISGSAAAGGGAGVAEVPQQQQHNNVEDNPVQPAYVQPPSYQLSQELIASLEDAYFELVDPPIVKGKMGNDTIDTYSVEEKAAGGYGEVYCMGCMNNGKGGTCCPGNAPGMSNHKIVIGGKKRAICRNCFLHIAEHFNGVIPFDLPDVDKVIYRTDNEDLEDCTFTREVTGEEIVMPRFMGDKELAQAHVNAGLEVGISGEFRDIAAVQMDMRTQGIEEKMFTQRLKRKVKLTSKGRWWECARGGMMKVPSFKRFHDKLLTPRGVHTVDVVDGWGSYYERDDEDELAAAFAAAEETEAQSMEEGKEEEEKEEEVGGDVDPDAEEAQNVVRSGIFGKFDWHRDAGLLGAVEYRLILTLLHHPDGITKRMYFVDRETGAWFSFSIPHGGVVILNHEVSGFSKGENQHKVEGAEGTYAIVLQVSILYNTHCRVLCQAHLYILLIQYRAKIGGDDDVRELSVGEALRGGEWDDDEAAAEERLL